MAFSFVLHKRALIGDLWIAFGTYTNTGGSTGGVIKTGLSKIWLLTTFPVGGAPTAQPYVNETFSSTEPILGSATVVTGANETGFWFALGEI